MAKEKKPDSKKQETEKAAASPLEPAVPPPDNPSLRHQQFDPDRDFESREMARKRAEAIKQTRKMKSSDEADKKGPSEKKKR
jgi:hypothetical protein